jgi:hypothetical protein
MMTKDIKLALFLFYSSPFSFLLISPPPLPHLTLPCPLLPVLHSSEHQHGTAVCRLCVPTRTVVHWGLTFLSCVWDVPGSNIGHGFPWVLQEVTYLPTWNKRRPFSPFTPRPTSTFPIYYEKQSFFSLHMYFNSLIV